MPSDPYRYFRIEGRELLEQLGKAVLDLEKGPAPAQVARILRLAHTLKGAARVVKQREIADAAHAIEDALALFRERAAAVPGDRIDALLRLLDEIAARLAMLAPVSKLTEVAEAAAGGGAAHAQPDEPLRTVRAEVVEIDSLLEGIAAAHAWLGALRKQAGRAERHGQTRDLALSVEQIDRELGQVRDTAERLRLVPAANAFTPLERTARDAAQALGKRVVFEGRNGGVRLDAYVLAAVQEALQHVVRNAVAHGIETAAGRSAAGKPAEGRVLLDVVRRRRSVAFVCTDDGQGVDLEAVRRAVRGKQASSHAAREPGAEDLMRLLLKGGISTTRAVSEISGRGIGLDVVREVAERLGGEVSMRTEPGRGTTLELVVPVSLASLEALVVQEAGRAMAIPLDAVQQTLRVLPGDLARTADGETLMHEGRLIPFVPLSRALATLSALSAKASPSHAARPRTAVLVRGAAGVAAIGVERLRGTASVLLRPLPRFAPAASVVAGASLDAEGNPQLVLDPDALVVEARRAAALPLEPAQPGSPILVIDDSLTTRMLEQSILESAGYEVDVAASAEEALEMAQRRRYALFLVDVEMPGMDGYAFIERARADPLLAGIASILVTSRASAEDRRRGVEAGARAHIVKSEFDQRELLRRIGELVG